MYPGVIAYNEKDPMSVLQRFKLFFGSDVLSLCVWTNTCAAHHFCDNALSDPQRFMGRKWVNVTRG